MFIFSDGFGHSRAHRFPWEFENLSFYLCQKSSANLLIRTALNLQSNSGRTNGFFTMLSLQSQNAVTLQEHKTPLVYGSAYDLPQTNPVHDLVDV